MSLKDFIKTARKNREKFLAPHKKKFDRLDPLKDRRKRAKIIVELLKAEPSHIDELWIRREIEKWLLDPNCRDYLDAIKPSTEKSRLRQVSKAMIFDRVESLRKQGLSVKGACEKLALDVYGRGVDVWLTLPVKDPDSQLDEKIRKIYYLEKKRRENQITPYYGRNIRIDPHG
jgi:hypothetical protein